MSKTPLQPYDQARAIMADAGLDFDQELQILEDSVNGSGLPRVRVEHRDNGRHRLYIDLGESYFDGQTEISLPKNRLEGIIVAYQHIRALWKEGETVPACAALDGIPNVAEPLAESCTVCPQATVGKGACKPKARLLLLARIKDGLLPIIFALSPTSIKHFNLHLRKLKRSGIPPIAVQTVFTLEDVKKNGYRWAETNLDVSGIAPKEMLLQAVELRHEYLKHLEQIHQADYTDPGDQAPKEKVGF